MIRLEINEGIAAEETEPSVRTRDPRPPLKKRGDLEVFGVVLTCDVAIFFWGSDGGGKCVSVRSSQEVDGGKGDEVVRKFPG